MCGFVGILNSSGNLPRKRQKNGELQRMATAVARRGPDDQGSFDDGSFAAIHHRLSIIGPDERGRQPMTVDDVSVVFNGCIYNYRELRAQLEQDGVRFVSDTDTEVLPYLYRRFGVGMFSLLNGMFSLVLWDARAKVLLAARDAFGEKPLFICEQDGRTGFASTLSAFEAGDWSLTPDVRAVRDILCRMRVEAPRTMYREVRQLPAGCYVRLQAGSGSQAGGHLQPTRFFFMPQAEPAPDLGVQQQQRQIGELLDAAFLARSVSDKPMGVFLSGGIDSSLIAESLARQLPEKLHTFSVRFADASPDYDESVYAATVAKHIGSEHLVLDVHAEAHEILHQLADAFDQPVANTAALPTFLIAREAKAYVDVALSGVGGDELFGGYPRYLGMAWHARLRRAPGRKLLLNLVHRLGEGAGSRNLRGRLRRLLEGLDLPAHTAYQQWISSALEPWDTMFQLAEDDVGVHENGWTDAASAFGGLQGLIDTYGPVQGAMAYDVLSYLPDDLLAVGDRMSMAHGLELRAPFLDSRLLDAAMQLPTAIKVSGPPWQEGLKLILKHIARERLPVGVVDRPKQGFMAPVKHWLRGPLQPEVLRLCQSDPLGGLMKADYLRSVHAQHMAGRDRSDVLWGVLLLDAWMHKRGWSFR
ncbi:MAG: asparagine synthase (glutamine-hydrolyzing) [Mariprofundaceae bacterium]|nr:asparagine synthase (glutamine-hydrolyzing) [Mariprofundaceae bacterium]